MTNHTEHWRENSRQTMEALGWTAYRATRETTQFTEWTDEQIWGGLYARPGLSPRDRELIVMPIITANPSPPGLTPHLIRAHHLGFTYDELLEMILMVAHYSGWPKASWMNTMFLTEILTLPDSAYPKPDVSPPVSGERLTGHEGALATYRELGSDMGEREYGATEAELMDQMYGSIWQRGVLSTRDRMLIAIALTAQTGMVDTLQPLFELAPNVGVTNEEIHEVILTVGIYGGWPRALEAARRFDRFVSERGDAK